MPHEFLFLFSNCFNRHSILFANYKRDLKSNYGSIYEWELAEGKLMHEMRKAKMIRHLHLVKSELSDNQERQNKKNKKYCIPNEIIQANLDNICEYKNI